MAKIRITARTEMVGSKSENIVDFEDWAEMTEEEREESCREIAFDMIDWNWEELE